VAPRDVSPTGNGSDRDALFLRSHTTVQRIVRALGRRHSLSPQDVEDFESLVMLRLLEDDSAILRRFRGDSALATYLTVVVAMLLHEWRVKRWGRWRPSAEARRRGELAVRVETLVWRDGHGAREAAELLRAGDHAGVTESEVRRLLSELPARAPLRPVEVGAEPLSSVAGSTAADDGILGEERRRARRAAEGALADALEQLDTEDRVLVRMRYLEGLGVAQIARLLGVPQKPLYRRIERSLARLRADLERRGFTAEQLAELLADLS
jgi:RNA polymerase sigma factor (sigma-70 family)